jgi:hypothetical protein
VFFEERGKTFLEGWSGDIHHKSWVVIKGTARWKLGVQRGSRRRRFKDNDSGFTKVQFGYYPLNCKSQAIRTIHRKYALLTWVTHIQEDKIKKG